MKTRRKTLYSVIGLAVALVMVTSNIHAQDPVGQQPPTIPGQIQPATDMSDLTRITPYEWIPFLDLNEQFLAAINHAIDRGFGETQVIEVARYIARHLLSLNEESVDTVETAWIARPTGREMYMAYAIGIQTCDGNIDWQLSKFPPARYLARGDSRLWIDAPVAFNLDNAGIPRSMTLYSAYHGNTGQPLALNGELVMLSDRTLALNAEDLLPGGVSLEDTGVFAQWGVVSEQLVFLEPFMFLGKLQTYVMVDEVPTCVGNVIYLFLHSSMPELELECWMPFVPLTEPLIPDWICGLPAEILADPTGDAPPMIDDDSEMIDPALELVFAAGTLEEMTRTANESGISSTSSDAGDTAEQPPNSSSEPSDTDTGDQGGRGPAIHDAIEGLYLGASVAAADGVTFAAPLVTGQIASVTLTATNTTGQAAYLQGFVDADADGDFEGLTERIATNLLIPDGSVDGIFATAFIVPDLPPGTAVSIRFRVSHTPNLGAGGSAASGEVEDYTVVVE
jgi:hypothetical protein